MSNLPTFGDDTAVGRHIGTMNEVMFEDHG